MDPKTLLADGDFVRDLARALITDPHRAEDAAQELWLSFLRRGPGPRTPLRNWVAAVLRNSARQMIRSDRNRAAREKAAARRETVPSVVDVAERESARRAVVEELLKLDAPYQSALLLHYYEQLPPREVARRLGIPVETARTRIRRGTEQLREALDARTPGGRDAWAVSLLPFIKIGRSSLFTSAGAGVLFMKAWMQAAAVAALLIFGIWIGWSVLHSPGIIINNPPSDSGGLAAASVPSNTIINEKESAAKKNGAESQPQRLPANANVPRVYGRIADLQNHNIAGARITAAPSPPKSAIVASDAKMNRNNVRAAVSAADGTFEIPLLEGESRLILLIEAKGFSPELIHPATPNVEQQYRLEHAQSQTGRVVDEAGVAIACAEITLSVFHGFSGFERKGVSAADGSYRIDDLLSVSKVTGSIGMSADRYMVRAEGYAPLVISENGNPFSGDLKLSKDFVMNRGVTLTGSVLDDETGKPVSDARIVLWNTGGLGGNNIRGTVIMNPFGTWIYKETKSGADGTFIFEHAPGIQNDIKRIQGEKPKACEIAVEARGYVTMGMHVDAAPAGSTVEQTLRLMRAATVRGRVVDEHSAPFEKVTVFVPRGSGEKRSWVDPEIAPGAGAMAVTSADGHYEINTIEASSTNETDVTVRTNLDAPVVNTIPPREPVRHEVNVKIRAGTVADAPDLVLPRGLAHDPDAPKKTDMTVEVTVISADGRPVAGAGLQIIPFGPATMTATRVTDSGGKAKINLSVRSSSSAESAETRSVMAEADGFSRVESESFEARAGETQQIKLIMNPAKTIRGIALRHDGGPAVGSFVKVSDPKNTTRDPNFSLAYTTAREDGSFELKGVPEGVFTITARHQRRTTTGKFESIQSSIGNISAGAENVILEFENDDADAPAGSLELAVTDAATGKPLLKFTAMLVRGLRSFYGRPGIPGRAQFDGVGPGEYELRVSAEGYATERIPNITIVADATASRATALGHGTAVRGTVHAPAGVALDGFEIGLDPVDTMNTAGHPSPKTAVAANGQFKIEGVAPGIWRVSVYRTPDPYGEYIYAAKWAVTHETVITVGANEVLCDPEISAAGTLRIKINSTLIKLEFSGPAATEAQLDMAERSKIIIKNTAGKTLYTLSGLDYRVSAEHGFPTGELIVRLEIPDREPIEQHVTIVAGKRATATFEVE
ncbi:MAG: sigma-70 family RNA polymerase sigma factor [Planctomycetes bacterium]|nr:sigma-70 family RNA polymerase sigma factor [Planctomycetota bacterium]